MSQTSPDYGPPRPPLRPQPDTMLRRGKFWLAITLVWFGTFSCTVMVSPPTTNTTKSSVPAATTTVTAEPTATTTANPATGKPAPTVTETKKVRVKVTKTVTAPPDSAGEADSDSDSGGGSVFYDNCTDARAQGAAPVHRSDPGYGRHLDRDGDGIGCD